jgi:hypothetical protein
MNKKYYFLIAFSILGVIAVFALSDTTRQIDNRHKSSKTIEESAPIVRKAPEIQPTQNLPVQELSESGPEEIPGAAATITESPKVDAVVSDLSEYPGFGHDDERDEQQFSEEERKRENLIAECMQGNGFEYTPAPSILVDEESMNNPEEFERLLEQSATDPNESYVQSLTPQMQKAYYLALTGMENPNEQESLPHDYASDSHSCVNQAFKQIPGVYAKFHSLRDQFDAMEEDIENDPRISSATRQWSLCMSNQGYEFESPSNVLLLADQALAELDSETGDNNDVAMIQDDLEKVKSASITCDQQAHLSKIREEVRVEYENRFVEKYKEQLTD